MTDQGADAAGRTLPLRHSDDIQGDILAGFRKDHETVLLLRFPDDQRPVRKWLRLMIPQIATTRQVAAFNAEFSAARHARAGIDPAGLSPTWVNLSLTYAGLKFLMGEEPFPDTTLPGVQAFIHGAFARAEINGDEGDSAPDHWLFGREDQPVHAVLTIASDEQAQLELRASELRVAAARAGLTVAFEQVGATLPGDAKGHEHFGFKDGVSQPGVRDFDRPDPRDPIHVDGKPGTRILPAGEFVIGHPKLTGDAPPLPDWTRNGSFQVVRRLAQDVPAWWAQAGAARRQLEQEGVELPPGTGTEWLAARVVGRWRSGASVAHNPNTEPPTKPGAPDDNLISYATDENGHTTPHFAHIRKTNPRDGIAGDFKNADTRRIIRRGIPFGQPFDPSSGAGHGPDTDRGLVFIAYMADLAEQFEFLQQRWINDKDFFQTDAGHDPVIGKDSDITLKLDTKPEGKKLHFAQFVRTEGTIYAFAPALTTLRDLAGR
ncbi:Dyp-type peroxidase [Kibdelosporangium philippinense]|uniref:Dyp-type peroxidase n=1 Tax=Kibdelosporangium philippinense TaxID=211113 RepID=A0ABS8ZNF2_9PSEU|nr:Dyp-type peroxidase [Kibdelosporangium philippinense]MCE7008485.1 Dyp-type peroxidase [Kibdelosporangium philippinense]